MKTWLGVVAVGLFVSLVPPCQAKEALSLGGTQSKKEVVVDLDKTDLTINDEYVVPQDCTLVITGSGVVLEDDKKQRTAIAVRGGKLELGDPKAKLKSLRNAPLVDMPDVGISVSGGTLAVQNCRLRVAYAKVSSGVFSGDHAAFDFQQGASSVSSKAEVTMDSCAIRGGLPDATAKGDPEPPADTKKHVKFRNCVFPESTERIGIGYLWCMSKCDILGANVLSSGKPAGAKAPNPVQQVHFSDRKYQEFLEKSLKDDYGMSIVPVNAPFNAALGVTAEAPKDPKEPKPAPKKK